MKIAESKEHNLESFGVKKEEKFDIGDVGFVLTLLRGQLYSNIIRTIAQEYMCNARDAHREINSSHTKIEVSLPTAYDLHWKCRDFGPGISPERMSNVFIQYGNSTKRGSNTETGGFGLGAKSAFGYSDSFIINTFIGGIKRSYCAVIDETERGILQLMSEQPTSEKNGTEIIVPVKNKDINQFHKESVSVIRHWKNPPVFKNLYPNTIEGVKVKSMLSGTRWFIEQHNRKSLYAVLDEIEYPIQDTMIDFNAVKIGNCNLYLEFKTGELEVAPNRETLKQSDSNKKKILAIIKNYEDEVKEILQKEIDKQETFADAVVNFDSIRNKLNISLDKTLFSWKGTQLIEQYQKLSDYGAYSCCYSSSNLFKLNKGNDSAYKIENGTIYVETERELNKTVEKALGIMLDKLKINKTKFSKICVINTRSVHPDKKKNLHLKEIGAHKLEDYYKFLDVGERKQALTKTLFFKLTSEPSYLEDSCSWIGFSSPDKSFTRSSLAAFDDDKGKKVYVFLDDEKYPEKKNKEKYQYSSTDLELLKALTGYNIYGFKLSQVSQPKIEELMADEGVVHVEELIQQEIDKHTADEWNEIVAYAYSARSAYGEDVSSTKLLPSYLVPSYAVSKNAIDILLKEEVQNIYFAKSPPFVKEYFEELKKLKTFEIENSKKAKIPSMVKGFLNPNPQHNQDFKDLLSKIKGLRDKFNEHYNVPFLQLSSGGYNNYRGIAELVEYVNLIDILKTSGYIKPVRPKILESK